MTATLLIPIHLDCFILPTPRTVLRSTADFSQLPYFDGTRDVKSSTPNIAEEILTQPFQSQTMQLQAGIHLHWALPDTLTRAKHNELGTQFPAVPNRWLVTRRYDNSPPKQWVVESDFLHPVGSEPNSAITIPFSSGSSNPPYRYLGRNLPIESWPDTRESVDYLPEPLTAIGYGEATFAAFYPNCFSVFGFFDPELTDNLPDNLSYDVIGWHEQVEDDLLASSVDNIIKELGLRDFNEALKKEIEERYEWTYDPGEDNNYPSQLMCFARISIAPTGENNETDRGQIQVAIANSGVEALSAYLASQLSDDLGERDLIESQLEAVQLATRLEQQQLDRHFKFLEARHERGFSGENAGSLWLIRQESPDLEELPNTIPLTPLMPQNVAVLLDQLNNLQQAYDKSMQEIETVRERIFADWYKYMLCVYPPDNRIFNYLNIDEVMRFIQSVDIPELEQRQSKTGQVTLVTSELRDLLPSNSPYRDSQLTDSGTLEGRSIIGAVSSEDSAQDSLAYKIVQIINEVLDIITSVSDELVQYSLRLIEAPRFWKPVEPVVLMVGDALKPSIRHGQDTYLSEEGLLECFLFTYESEDSANLLMQDSKIRDQVSNCILGIDKANIGISTYTEPSWHPFMLDWQAELRPLSNLSNRGGTSPHYAEEFIIENYQLLTDAVDLSPTSAGSVVRTGDTYSGSSILTPHASLHMKEKLEAYLCKYFLGENIVSDYLANTGETLEDEETQDKYFENNIQSILNWYETSYSNADPAIINIINAYKLLDQGNLEIDRITEGDSSGFYALSQALSGFNSALLMHKQTMQLRIADPLAFDDYRPFTEDLVHNAVQDRNRLAPQPLNSFNPIRSGILKINRLRLIDTFGRWLDLDPTRLISTSQWRLSANSNSVQLPPRLVQAARVNFRWLAAMDDVDEVNTHSATTPICGWIMPNILDNSLMIYDSEGHGLGSLNNGGWHPLPGDTGNIRIDDISDKHLRQMLNYLSPPQDASLVNPEEDEATFLDDFRAALLTALDNIDPASAHQHHSQALLVGRPIALVRAKLNLELKGLPAIHHGWRSLESDMQGDTRETNQFGTVKFPIRLGEYKQLNDGLVGYWKEKTNGNYEDDIFYSLQSEQENEYIKTHDSAPFNLTQSLDDLEQTVVLLLDPRGKVHVTTGILPTKAIEIPPYHFSEALRNIEVSFLTAPVLSPMDQISVAIPDEPGINWSWLEQKDNKWDEVSAFGTIRKRRFQDKFGEESGEDIWDCLCEIDWIREITNLENDNPEDLRAEVVPAHKRNNDVSLGLDIEMYRSDIEVLLYLAYIAKPLTQANFPRQVMIREGWLKMNPWIQEADSDENDA